MLKKMILVSGVLFSTLSLEAADRANLTISTLGSHSGQVFYMNFKEGMGGVNCKNNVVYCPTSDDNCKNYYPLVLATKVSGKKLSRVAYNRASNGYCTVWLVAFD